MNSNKIKKKIFISRKNIKCENVFYKISHAQFWRKDAYGS